jgi:hypothetical protein
MLRLVLSIALMAIATSSVSAEETYDDGSYTLFLNAGVGRFSGDYGFEETTTMDVFNLSARWYLAKGEIQVSVPYLRIEGPADIRFIGGQPVAVPGAGGEDLIGTDSGLGDAVLQGEYYLLSGTETRPWVIGLVRVKLPTGSEDKGLGTGATDVEAGVGLIQRYGPLHWLADIGYTWVGSSGGFELQDVVRAGAGVSAPFGPNERHNAYLYLENRTHLVKGSEDRRSLSVGIGSSLDRAERVRVSGSVFVGLSDTAEDWGVYLTLGRRY